MKHPPYNILNTLIFIDNQCPPDRPAGTVIVLHIDVGQSREMNSNKNET
jgi:hypothetical protein